MTCPARKLTGLTLNLGEVILLVGTRLSLKVRNQHGPDCAGETWEQHEVYEAMQTTKATLSEQPELNEIPAILKVKTQLVPWSNKPDSCLCSEEIWNEIRNLEAAEKCESTPKLLNYHIKRQGDGDILPGGYIAYIVMNKVTGENLERYRRMEKKEQHQVQIAFLDALWDFRACHLRHGDPRLENVIWDPDLQKCYIVDLEDVEHDSTRKPEDICLDPWEHLGYWGLIGNDQVRDPELFYSKDAMIQSYQEQLEHSAGESKEHK
ncbi:hypothetical protein PHISCL_00439 [Aspergillus sclerotialis]|uniref:Aminoglycoside phosphotransferase domain-containing protein n=1 Tax=Aspergillus sclerotialis TaxID=2070753 RepID=A0A3A2ZVN0_9EURO|nr:hypothetical protein PHISCL_00439 [Aspergillus sclerotialis]